MTTTADILSFLAGRGFTEAAEAVAAQFPTGQPEGGWRPISEAPTDRPVLLWNGAPVIGFWSQWNSYWTDGTSDRMRDHVRLHPAPTHWLSFPPSPTQGEQQP